MFIIALPHGLALGTVFDTAEAAHKTAERLGLQGYEIQEQEPAETPLMGTQEAIAELEAMLASTTRDGDQIVYNLAKEREEYKRDPSDDTKWIIERLDRRLARVRNRELVLKFCLQQLRK